MLVINPPGLVLIQQTRYDGLINDMLSLNWAKLAASLLYGIYAKLS